MSYSQDPNAPIDLPSYDPEVHEVRRRWSWATTCLVTALGLFTIAVIGCVGAAWYLYHNSTRLMAPYVRTTAEVFLRDVELPAAEKEAILTQVDRVVAALKENKLTRDDLGQFMKEFAESPLFGAWMLIAVEQKYVQPSGLSDEEKQQAVRVMERLLRGVHEKQIRPAELQDIQDMILEPQANGSKKLKEKLDDDELREVIAACRKKVDVAEVPDEPFEISISEEIQRLVDRLLMKTNE